MTLPPINQQPISSTQDSPWEKPAQAELNQIELEILAEKVIDMIRRELLLDKERGGKLP